MLTIRQALGYLVITVAIFLYTMIMFEWEWI